MNPVPLFVRRLGEEVLECQNEVSRVAASGTVKPTGRRKDDAAMTLTGAGPDSHDTAEVLDVLGDYGPIVGGGSPEEILVGQRSQPRVFRRSERVVTVLAQLLGRPGRVVNVEEQLHPASSC